MADDDSGVDPSKYFPGVISADPVLKSNHGKGLIKKLLEKNKAKKDAADSESKGSSSKSSGKYY